jgi:hypothetical protein
MSGAPGESADELAADLARLVGTAHSADAVRERVHQRSLHDQAAADALLVGLLVDLAEEDADITIRMASGRLHRGRVRAVGRDFVVLGPPGRSDAATVGASSPSGAAATAGGAAGEGVAIQETCLAMHAISVVRRRPGPRGRDATGDRPAARAVGLTSYLAGLAPERPRVAIVVAGEPTTVVGELRAVGRDVATIRLDGEARVTAYVALDSLSEVLVSG